jgi:antitoxin component YwqK of YwqJK toxin-antitoxin module
MRQRTPDDEHLNLCDNEKECGDAGGYWYNNQCNVNPEEDTSDGDTFDGEFSCPIPKEASHIVSDRSEYWSTPNGFVGPYYTWYDEEKTKKHRFYCYNIEGERHGLAKEWYDDGTPKYEDNYKDGKYHGVSKGWYENGIPKYEWNYKDGKYHGVYKVWRNDGTPKSERNYKDGKKHGVSKGWYEDITPEYEMNYKDGKVHGVYKEWYENGTLEYERNYKDGKKHGVSKWWFANGKLIHECNYEEGKCVSCVHGHC